MAKLSRLNICGIRSFGPGDDEMQEIKFGTPVTLILGENGCGKTTIIESLKYAFTGELPGGTKSGQGFVYDPKLNSTSVTKGRVLLKFFDAKGNQVTISKAMKVEQRNLSTQKFSSLDSTIKVIKPNGESFPLSSRCADIGEQACSFMGISKSIINNVIFCHQENSLWPLDEAKKLKEKFDEIFDSTKYNVCIDSIRKKIKSKTDDMKLLKQSVEYQRERKDFVEKERAKLQQMEEEVTNIKQNIETKQKEIKPIYIRIQSICELEDKFGKLQKAFGAKETEKSSIVEQQKNILKKLEKEFEGTDWDLERTIKEFDENFSKIDFEIKNLENQNTKYQDEESKLDKSIQKCQVRIGQKESEKRQQDKAIGDRNELIKQMILHVDPTINCNLEIIQEITEAMKSLHTSVEKTKLNFKSLSDGFNTEENRLQKNIDTCREDVVKLEQRIKTNQNQLFEGSKKVRLLNTELKKLDFSDDELNLYNKGIDKIDRELAVLSNSSDTESLTSKISNNNHKIKSEENSLEDLEKEYKILQKNAIIENNIDIGTRDNKRKQTEIEGFKSKYFEELEQLFPVLPDENYKMCIEKCQNENQTKVISITKSIDAKKKDITKHETNIHFQKNQLKDCQDELSANEKQIFDLCSDKPFNRICDDVGKDIERLQKTRGQLRSAKVMYEKFIKDFQAEKPCCPICDTSFDNKKNDVNRIITKIENQIRGIPSEVVNVENKLKKQQELFNKIQQLKPVYEKTENLKNTLIPRLKTEINDVSEKLDRAQRDLKKLSEDLYDPQKKVDNCNKIIGDAVLIDNYQNEIKTTKNEIKNLQSQLVKTSSNKSQQEVESEINGLKIKILELRKQVEIDQKKLDHHKTKSQKLREQRNDIVEKRLKLEKTMQEKPQLQQQLKELSEKQKLLEEEIKNEESQLIPHNKVLKESIAKLNEVKTNNTKVLDEERHKNHKLEKDYENLEKLQASVEEFHKRNIEGQFTAALELYKTTKSDMDALKIKMENTGKEILKLKQQLASREFEKRKLEDNVELRKLRKQADRLTDEINTLTQEIGDYNFKDLQKEKVSLQSKYLVLQKDICNIEGQQSVLDKSIEELKNELNKPEKKNVYKKYKEKVFEQKVAEKALADLKLYVLGLENAIIEFHKDKMLTINRATRELWRSIYRGNDIDYVQIRTEESNTLANKRVYDYKVVQIKNGTEIEMRGRCSAGQKVLACLVIRMALAETFSHNCGILALDEPTTNLDRENILSLSEALGRMVNNRRKEKNFQMIIITHDEEFIRKLSQIENINYCLRVSRNNKGTSIVTQEVL